MLCALLVTVQATAPTISVVLPVVHPTVYVSASIAHLAALAEPTLLEAVLVDASASDEPVTPPAHGQHSFAVVWLPRPRTASRMWVFPSSSAGSACCAAAEDARLSL